MPPSKADNATAPVGIDMTAQNVMSALPLSAPRPLPEQNRRFPGRVINHRINRR